MLFKKTKGFTLMEVMITVVIVGILAAIAIPNYEEYARRAKRADGTASLLRAAHNLERCGSTFGRYDHNNCAAARANQNSADSFYLITVTNATASTYTLNASARNEQLKDNPFCDNFTIDQTGVKGATTTNGKETVDTCWNN